MNTALQSVEEDIIDNISNSLVERTLDGPLLDSTAFELAMRAEATTGSTDSKTCESDVLGNGMLINPMSFRVYAIYSIATDSPRSTLTALPQPRIKSVSSPTTSILRFCRGHLDRLRHGPGFCT